MIVGIGASAGGLDAFRSFFSEMPNDSGMAFVLVQHLDPDYNSALAEDQGENAVGIILSGFGNDGTIGIAAIKEAGGLTLSEAAFDHRAKFGMPQSATAGGFVDYVLQPQEMPACLLEYRDFKNKDAAPGLSESSAAGRAIPGHDLRGAQQPPGPRFWPIQIEHADAPGAAADAGAAYRRPQRIHHAAAQVAE